MCAHLTRSAIYTLVIVSVCESASVRACVRVASNAANMSHTICDVYSSICSVVYHYLQRSIYHTTNKGSLALKIDL